MKVGWVGLGNFGWWWGGFLGVRMDVSVLGCLSLGVGGYERRGRMANQLGSRSIKIWISRLYGYPVEYIALEHLYIFGRSDERGERDL